MGKKGKMKEEVKNSSHFLLKVHHVHETGCSGLVHWDDPGGWGGEGGGRGVQDREHMYTHGWFMSMYDKNHHNTVK